jgi:hypothetical protein
MFRLKDTENDIELDLSIIGYQFPNNLKDNWCLLKVALRQGDKSFEVIDPALETVEIVELLEWFRSLSEHKLPRFVQLVFNEPCIEFACLGYNQDSVRISINLNHEIKPNFELSQFGTHSKDWNIIFDLDTGDFKSIITGIEVVVAQFPQRG